MSIRPDSIMQIVAIDGPAGAGKSTVARRVARDLGFAYLDTGAMYRAATWRALHNEVNLNDPEALVASTRAMALEMDEKEGRQQVVVDGHEVADAIRSPEVTRRIWRLDHNRDVRAHLVELQRAIGARRPTVAEGRDMGTVVFPEARCKVYLDASIEVRAQRRARELEAKKIPFDLKTLRAEIEERDRRDQTRAESPLRRAQDATLVDTTSKTIEEVVDEIVRLARATL